MMGRGRYCWVVTLMLSVDWEFGLFVAAGLVDVDWIGNCVWLGIDYRSFDFAQGRLSFFLATADGVQLGGYTAPACALVACVPSFWTGARNCTRDQFRRVPQDGIS